ncbi:hypothetical protein EDD11_009021 [Mortierella claussenii]|nr:hypothetical protein EDD11_009021 [Mortierella claussenii]
MFIEFKNRLLKAMQEHRQNSTIVSPSVIVDKSSLPTNASAMATSSTAPEVRVEVPPSSSILELKNYKPCPDRGALTVRAALEEFYGPLSNMRKLGLLPKNSAIKKAFERRRRFVQLVEAAAKAEGRPVMEVADEWTEKYKETSINSLREKLEGENKENAVEENNSS